MNMSDPIMPPEIEEKPKKTSGTEEPKAPVTLSALMENMQKDRGGRKASEGNGKAAPTPQPAQEPRPAPARARPPKRGKLRGIDDHFFFGGAQEESLNAALDRACATFKQLTGREPRAGFLQNVQLSGKTGGSGEPGLLDFKRLFLFNEGFLLMKERHSTVRGVLIPIRKRVVSLSLDDQKDILVLNFTLDDGRDIPLRAVNSYRKVLEELIVKEFLVPNMKG